MASPLSGGRGATATSTSTACDSRLAESLPLITGNGMPTTAIATALATAAAKAATICREPGSHRHSLTLLSLLLLPAHKSGSPLTLTPIPVSRHSSTCSHSLVARWPCLPCSLSRAGNAHAKINKTNVKCAPLAML